MRARANILRLDYFSSNSREPALAISMEPAPDIALVAAWLVF